MSVYFAQAGRYTKIGYSADPIGRMTTVTRNGKRPADLPSAADVHLIGWIPGDEWREGALHARFTAQRVSGEWFALDEAQVQELRDVIWSDPRGVDAERMSALAVLAADRYPEATRDDIAAAGIRVEAASLDEAMAALDLIIGGAA